MQIIDGRACAQIIQTRTAEEVRAFLSAGRRAPQLAVILAGSRADSRIYVQTKYRTCSKVGIGCRIYELPGTVVQDEVLRLVRRLNGDPSADAVLVQLPLPESLDRQAVLNAIDYRKDADGLHPMNVGLLHLRTPRVVPCTPHGIIALLDHYNIPIAGRRAAVVGRSALVGEPVAQLLSSRNATVTLCHSHTDNLPEIVGQADILVLAAGSPGVVSPADLKENVTVIDVAMNRRDGKLYGDIYCPENLPALSRKVHAITPVPGGVGPMTIAMLMRNIVQLYRQHMQDTGL